MSLEFKRLLKMSALFTLFFLPFVWCVAGILSGFMGTTLIDSPWLGGRMEPYGFGLVFTGLGAALFGRELFDAIGEWRSMRQRRRPKQDTRRP